MQEVQVEELVHVLHPAEQGIHPKFLSKNYPALHITGGKLIF